MVHLQCWICVKEDLKIDCSQYQGGRPHIYSAKEVQTVGDVRQSIPWIYATLDNMQVNHQVIIKMENNLCDQVASILIDLGSNYSYVSLELVDKCGLSNEFHE